MVTAGTSAVNQAPVTGESIPVDKAVGDALFAGTKLEDEALRLFEEAWRMNPADRDPRTW